MEVNLEHRCSRKEGLSSDPLFLEYQVGSRLKPFFQLGFFLVDSRLSLKEKSVKTTNPFLKGGQTWKRARAPWLPCNSSMEMQKNQALPVPSSEGAIKVGGSHVRMRTPCCNKGSFARRLSYSDKLCIY